MICLSQLHEQVDEIMKSILLWNKYFVKFIQFVRICVVRLLSTLKKLSWSLKRVLKISNDSVKQTLRWLIVRYSFQSSFYLEVNNFLRISFENVFSIENRFLLFLAELVESDAFAFFERNGFLSSSTISRWNQFFLDFVAMRFDENDVSFLL